MNIPRFTAEASLFKTRTRYFMANATNSVPAQAIQMSARVQSPYLRCTGACNELFKGDLDANTACIDYCNCVHIAKQSSKQCRQELGGVLAPT